MCCTVCVCHCMYTCGYELTPVFTCDVPFRWEMVKREARSALWTVLSSSVSLSESGKPQCRATAWLPGANTTPSSSFRNQHSDPHGHILRGLSELSLPTMVKLGELVPIFRSYGRMECCERL